MAFRGSMSPPWPRLGAGSFSGTGLIPWDCMGLLGVFGLLWLAAAVVYLAHELHHRSSHDVSVWRSKYSASWPKSRRGHWACALVLAVVGLACLMHDYEPAWDLYAVPALFAAGGVLLVARWADRLAHVRSCRPAERNAAPDRNCE
jgi:hypothetical protein